MNSKKCINWPATADLNYVWNTEKVKHHQWKIQTEIQTNEGLVQAELLVWMDNIVLGIRRH